MTTRAEIDRLMGVKPQPAVEPKTEPTPSVNLSALTELLTAGEIASLHRRAGDFYAGICRKDAAAISLLHSGAEALGVAPDRALRIVHALARVVGLRAPSPKAETLAAATVAEAIMIPLFDEEN